MRAVKSANTTPELVVRTLVHRLGYRFRLHAAELPGKPDLVLPRHRKAIFVHGCFWHRHRCDAGRSTPGTRQKYWRVKFARNVERDRLALRRLRRAGWSVLVVWECHTKTAKRDQLTARLRRFLETAAAQRK